MDATINTNGLLVNNLTFPNETSVTIGYKREGLLKPLSPVVKLTHTNPYMQTKAVSNVIIEEKKNPLTDHKVWGGVGLLIGLILLGAYFVYQMKASDKSSRTSKFFIELILAIAASIFLGTGVFFMCLDFDLWL